MLAEKPKVIIIKKKKKAHVPHHGGSWKVAYADFVTAMMAFFMVMWILGLDQSVRSAIEEYFGSPIGLKGQVAAGSSPVSRGSGAGAIGMSPIRYANRREEEAALREIGRRLEARLQGADGLGTLAAQVDIIMTQDGLRIELVEAGDGETFFAFGSTILKPAAERAVRVIAFVLKDTPAALVVEGHTDSAPFGSHGYSNWELSSDRAHAARRTLESAGVSHTRIRQIRGYADHELRNPNDPLDPGNRRITILLPFTTPVAETPVIERVPGPDV